MTIHIFLVEFPKLSLGCEGYISSRDVSAVKSVIANYFGFNYMIRREHLLFTYLA